ncbi:hypothetical protein F4Y93_11830 [Candidatus Poribacteria bacterium]|nr:hypothetical protein [Candidatus Poribacteria bacterium]
MSKNVKKILIAVAMIMALWFPIRTGFPNPYEIGLRWKNGDVLTGELRESSAGTIRWSSPYFLDDLILDVKVLDGVAFRKQDSPPTTENRKVSTTEMFRVSTLSGDVWIVDLIGSDDDTFLFSSKRHGQFRVNRSAVYMLERRERPDFLFDGSQLKNWKLPKPQREAVDPALPFDFVRHSDWFADPEGHPKTWIDKAEIFYAFNWSEHFEIELELASDAHPPNFSFAFGKDLYQALRLETWKDELVAVQGVLFKSVLAIQPEQRSIHLRLTYHPDAGVLRVFGETGNFLLELKDIEPTVKDSGIYIQNRGEDLTVRNVKVYRQLKDPEAQRMNLSKPRVYMTNGEKLQGRLFVQGDDAYVLDTEGTRRDIDLQALNHIIQPGVPSAKLDETVTLKYPDKVVLHGKLMQVKSDSLVLQTAFADEPVTCSLSDALLLQFAAEPDISEADKNKDKLVLASENRRGRVVLCGRVVFGGGQGTSSVQWESVGALKPVRLAYNRDYHIERNDKSAVVGETGIPVKAGLPDLPYARFWHTLHLKNGEILSCQISAYDGESVHFQSPFISAQHLDSVDIKALEFSDRTHAPSMDRTQPATDFKSLRITRADRENGMQEVKIQVIGWGKDGNQFIINADNLPKIDDGRMVLKINEVNLEGKPVPEWIEIAPKKIVGQPGGEWLTFLNTPSNLEKDKSLKKLERALTVPRFNRDNPPNHILVAKTGDMKRGTLLDFQGQTIQFDSKLREFSIPIDRVARVVNISDSDGRDERMGTHASTLPLSQPKSEVRVTLTDGSILIFEPLEVQDDRLLGRSSIYGEVSVPVDSIRYLHFGERAKSFTAAFEKWTVRPAKEPTYGDSP